MAVEIERKFLVLSDGWRGAIVHSERLVQGYLADSGGGQVRVRCGDRWATIAVKGPRRRLTRSEYEYAVPPADARYMLNHLCRKPLIEKIRHQVAHAGFIWEVDVYGGAATGLVVAELELSRHDQTFPLPPWVGQEITGDRRFSNTRLARMGLFSNTPDKLEPPRPHRAPAVGRELPPPSPA